MNRFWERAFAIAAGAAFAGSMIPACAHDDATMFIRGVQAPPTAGGNGGVCIYTPDPTASLLSQGQVDAALTTSYTPVVLVGNQLVSRGSVDEVRAETSRVNIQGAFVKVVDPADGSVVMDNTVLTSGTIDPGAGNTPSWASFAVTLMNQKALAHFDPGAVGAPSKIAISYVKVYGQTLGGVSVETNEFQFPIYVCHGCLVSIPAGAAATKYCEGGSSGTTSTDVKEPCVAGWDQAVDCTLCYPNPVCDPTKR
jgi:hypothetical protein